MRKKFFVLATVLVCVLSLMAATPFVAAADFSAGIMTDVPVWAKNHTANVNAAFESASGDLGAAQNAVYAAVNDKTRILLAQNFENGLVYMNEVEGKAFTLTDEALLNYWYNGGAPKGVIIGRVLSKGGVSYLVTDTTVIKNDNGNVSEESVFVGKLPEDYSNTVISAERLSDRFADAYRMAENHVTTYSLGLPTTNVTTALYTTKDLTSFGKYTDPLTTSEKTYYIQAFEGGYIIQARLLNCPHYAAAPISNEMYALVKGLTDNADFNVTGAPVSREYTVNGVTMQNFEYGYVKVEGGVASFVEDKVVAPNGTEMYRKVGSFEDNWEKTWNVENTFIEFDQVRKSEQIRIAVGAYIDSGIVSEFTATLAQTGHPCHEFAGRGAMQKFTVNGAGAKVGGANLFAIVGYWYDDVYMINNGDFMATYGAYFKQGENKLGTGVGFPLNNATTFKGVKYQVYTWGVIYKTETAGADEYTCVKQAAFNALMEQYGDVESALVGTGVIDLVYAEGNYKGVWESNPDATSLQAQGIDVTVDECVIFFYSLSDADSPLLTDASYGIRVSNGTVEKTFAALKVSDDGKFGIALYGMSTGSYTITPFVDIAGEVTDFTTVNFVIE